MAQNTKAVLLPALKAAWPITIPICGAFFTIGISYGFLMHSLGFHWLYPALMSFFIFAGSMEFVTINLLMTAFNPLHAFLLTLMVNARHLFYGISMLERYSHVGLKKYYLIYGMCDESFSINVSTNPPAGVDRGWYMFFVTLLNQIYWVAGATCGALAGYLIKIDSTGIDFMMTALFAAIFLGQWDSCKDHRPALIGLGAAFVCLLVFGAEGFVIPAMVLILICVSFLRKFKRPGTDCDVPAAKAQNGDDCSAGGLKAAQQ